MFLFGDFEYHLQISVGIYIPNSWVMFNWDIYQPLNWGGWVGSLGLDQPTILDADRLVFATGWTNLRMAGMGLVPRGPRAHEDRVGKSWAFQAVFGSCSGSTTTRENKDISMP